MRQLQQLQAGTPSPLYQLTHDCFHGFPAGCAQGDQHVSRGTDRRRSAQHSAQISAGGITFTASRSSCNTCIALRETLQVSQFDNISDFLNASRNEPHSNLLHTLPRRAPSARSALSNSKIFFPRMRQRRADRLSPHDALLDAPTEMWAL